MTRRRLTDILSVLLGLLYIVAGIAETVRAVVTGDGGILFWFGSLVGGGALILLGRYGVRDRPWLYFGMTATGCLAGAVATLWTLLVPLLALVVVVLALLRAGDEIDRLQSAGQ